MPPTSPVPGDAAPTSSAPPSSDLATPGAPPWRDPATEEAWRDARQRVRRLRRFYRHLLIYLLVNTGLILVYLVTQPPRPFFLPTLLGWGLGVAIHGFLVWTRFGLFGREWEARKIADDEEHLRDHLAGKLARLWPELTIVARAPNGQEALAEIRRLEPDLAFLDIRMPGLTGLEVAREAAGGPTRFIFVTAFDQYALDAFEREAVDYLVKPVSDGRLARTLDRLKRTLAEAAPRPDVAALLDQLLARGAAAGWPGTAGTPGATAGLPVGSGTGAAGVASAAGNATAIPGATGDAQGNGSAPAPLRWIRASLGDTTRHVPVEEVRFFRSDDKYTVVHTTDGERLIRTPLAELIGQLDGDWFWQIHRSTVVNMRHVTASRRDDTGRVFVQLKPDGTELPVSRAYVHRFKQM